MMNSIKIISNIFFLSFLFASMVSFGQDKVIPAAELPATIQSYISTHFSKQTITKAEKDLKEYEVELSDQTELKFNNQTEIIKIDGKTALPESVIPKKIADYVKTNYADQFITGWETEWQHQEVQLNNGVELEFTMKDEFVRIDK